jgi:glycosyltransferase involved in cell wall biosynthesis
MQLLPISTIIPTLDRRERLTRTLASLFAQSAVPIEVLVVDASVLPVTPADLPPAPAGVQVRCLRAEQRGAAAQRNQAQRQAAQPFILYMDDDMDLEPGCIAALWSTLQANPRCGGCGTVLTNQQYHPPGPTMRRILAWLGCPPAGSLAGRCVGPALNFLPLPDETSGREEVDWLNLGCTLYRREALPQPALLGFFHGYSLMEDAALSLHVGRSWGLRIPKGARAFHDFQPAPYKSRVYAREKMETVNRWYVMRMIMRRKGLRWDFRQLCYQNLMLVLALRRGSGWPRFPGALAGKIAGIATVVLHAHRWRGYQDSNQ